MLFRSPAQTPVRKNKLKFTEGRFADVLNDTDPLRENVNESISTFRSMMDDEFQTMKFDSRDAVNFGMQRQQTMQPQSAPKIMEDPETGKVYEVKPEVADALTRDYRALLKAVDAKKGR